MARTRWLATAAAWSCVAILVSPPGPAADDAGSPAPEAAGDRDAQIIQVLLSGGAEERLETAAHLPLDLRFGIGRHDDPAPATEALVGDLVLVLRQEPDEWIARTLLESLVWRTQPAFDPLFLAGLRSVSVNLQATAISRYRFRKDAEAAATLESLWERDLPGWIRPRLLAALATQGSISHLDEFVRLTRDADADLRRAAIEALGRLGRDETIPALVRVLRDEPRPDVVVAAIRALGSFPDSGEAREEVLRASRSTDPSILGAAVVSLGRFPQWEAGARLIALLDAPPDPDLRAVIPSALEATTHPDATAALVRLLHEPDVTPNSWIASRAILALFNRDDPGALPGLDDLRQAGVEGARDDLGELIEYLSRDRSDQNRTFMMSTDCPTRVVSSGDPDAYRVAPSQPFLTVRCWDAPDRPGDPAIHPRIPAGTPVRIVDHFERPRVSWVEIDGRGVNSCWVPRDALLEGGADPEPASWPRIHLRVEVDLGAEDLASSLATRLRAAGLLSVFEPGGAIEGAALELDAADRDQAAAAAALVSRDTTPLAGALRALLSQGLEHADAQAVPDPGSGPDEDAADPDAGDDANVDGPVGDSR